VPNDLLEQVTAKIAALQAHVETLLPGWRGARDPEAVRAMELDVAAAAREMADGIAGAVLRAIAADPVLQAEASLAARSEVSATGRSRRHGGVRSVEVTLLGGSSVSLDVEYQQPNYRSKKRRTKKKTRGKGGAGLFPVLAALGIWFGVTPALAGEVCRQIADSDSVRAGRAALERRGILLSQRKALALLNSFSCRAVDQRRRWMDIIRQCPARVGPLRGKRVVVATDGGRIRQRVPAKAGRRRANGHQRYDAPWVEPKLLVIYVIDDEGKMLQEFRPVYDGTQQDCNAIFDMLEAYLKALGAHEARQLIFVADGAKWIWERTAALAVNLGVASEKVVEVVDKGHAVGTLYKIAEARKGWSTVESAEWIKKARRLLRGGSSSALVAHIHGLAVGRNAKDISSHEDYFARNEKRMQYRTFVKSHIPTGSGAVESAVRRVINMRMKSNAMFWREVNAEGMLLLRAYLKAERFDDLINWSLLAAAPWWRLPSPAGPVAEPATTATHTSMASAAADSMKRRAA